MTLAEVGGCWEYQDTYTCIKPNAVDYCSAFRQIPGCWQVSSTCAVTDTTFGTGCMQWDNTWRCGNPALSTPPNTIRVADSYTIVTDTLNNTQCQSYANSPTCAIASHICVEPAATRIINGLPVYKDCWSWQDNYSCLGTPQTDCGALQARGCALNTSQCLTTATQQPVQPHRKNLSLPKRARIVFHRCRLRWKHILHRRQLFQYRSCAGHGFCSNSRHDGSHATSRKLHGCSEPAYIWRAGVQL